MLLSRLAVAFVRAGSQYVVIAVGGDGKAFGRSGELIAFALPRMN